MVALAPNNSLGFLSTLRVEILQLKLLSTVVKKYIDSYYIVNTQLYRRLPQTEELLIHNSHCHLIAGPGVIQCWVWGLVRVGGLQRHMSSSAGITVKVMCTGYQVLFGHILWYINNNNNYNISIVPILLLWLLLLLLLAHLSTKCSRWAFVMAHCPSSIVRACVRASTISINNISSETTHWILTKLHRNDPWVVPYQSCSNRSSWLHK